MSEQRLQPTMTKVLEDMIHTQLSSIQVQANNGFWRDQKTTTAYTYQRFTNWEFCIEIHDFLEPQKVSPRTISQIYLDVTYFRIIGFLDPFVFK